MSFIAGETVGSYRILEPLGQGGMAAVFKAYHAALDRYVAIKVMHLAFNEDKSFLGRFQREARVVARLEHPNIVPIYDFAEHEGRPYLVMKYIEGETLKARLDHGPLSEAELLHVLDGVGAALAYAHRQGVLHRDIKPSNVLLAPDGAVYLADFGLARIAQAGESSITADRLVGTPQYMSPEQALSKPDLDARTDIYSLGVVCYELLVGKVPFNADTPFAIIHDHIYTPLPLPRARNPQLSEGVERVLLKSLAKDRDDRFADVPAFMMALREALTGGPDLTGSAAGAWDSGAALTAAGAQGRGSAVTAVAPGADTAPLPDSATLPMPALPVEPAGAATVEKARPSEMPGVPRASVVKSFPKKAWFAVGAVLLVGVVWVISSLLGGGVQAPQEVTRTAPVVNTAPPPPPTAVVQPRPELIAVVDLWKRGDMAGATQRLNTAMKAAGDDAAFYRDSLDYLIQNQAWLMAALLVFSPDAPRSAQGMLTQRERVQDLHQVLYMSAADPLSKDFLQRNADKILFFRVAPMRYELLFGNPAKAKQDLGQILATPEQFRLYPEARVLEIELLQKTEPARARPRLNELLKEQDTLPEWVRLLAQELDRKIPR